MQDEWILVRSRTNYRKKNKPSIQQTINYKQKEDGDDFQDLVNKDAKTLGTIKKIDSIKEAIVKNLFYIHIKDYLTCNLYLMEKIDIIICYGIGSFCNSKNALYQIAFILVLLEEMIETNKNIKIQVYDPVMNQIDKEIAIKYNIEILEDNIDGKLMIDDDKRVMFYMPHCPQFLYHNVLSGNWSIKKLKDIIILGNSFQGYHDRLLIKKEVKEKLLFLVVLPCTTEYFFNEKHISKDDENYYNLLSAFNDLSIHYFPEDKLLQENNNKLFLKIPPEFPGDYER